MQPNAQKTLSDAEFDALPQGTELDANHQPLPSEAERVAALFDALGPRCPAVHAFASSTTDAELMLRAADELEATADMLCSYIAGARLLRSQAVALRKLARKR